MARTEPPSLVNDIRWLAETGMIAALLIAGWVVIWLLGAIFWSITTHALSGRPRVTVPRSGKHPFLPMTKPLQLAALGFVMSAMATYGFGADCFQYHGVGSCDYIRFN